ncbi:MAG TPA: membrane protein insertion efficiency factor YidD [Pseudomonadaceae bacterium]|nr:membrane protein insertion efficiency factor YidD [Pseudomonadaceae bacterium]
MAPRRLLLLLIRCYQTLLSPLLGPHCRFHPTCSCYAHSAIAQYGCWKGAWLALRRIVRCTPFSDGGLDPVPQPPSSKRIKKP